VTPTVSDTEEAHNWGGNNTLNVFLYLHLYIHINLADRYTENIGHSFVSNRDWVNPSATHQDAIIQSLHQFTSRTITVSKQFSPHHN